MIDITTISATIDITISILSRYFKSMSGYMFGCTIKDLGKFLKEFA
jgi:hypothetical protein